MQYLMVYMAAVNLAAFILCGVDKSRAKRGMWRVPEKNLFVLAGLGGAPGLILAMKLFHHKTRHKSFTIGVPAMLMAQIAIVLFVLYRMGEQPW